MKRRSTATHLTHKGRQCSTRSSQPKEKRGFSSFTSSTNGVENNSVRTMSRPACCGSSFPVWKTNRLIRRNKGRFREFHLRTYRPVLELSKYWEIGTHLITGGRVSSDDSLPLAPPHHPERGTVLNTSAGMTYANSAGEENKSGSSNERDCIRPKSTDDGLVFPASFGDFR